MASVGAAIASVIAEFSILFYQMLYICKKDRTLKLKQLFNYLWTCIISCMCMALIVVLVKPFIQPNFLGTIWVAVIGACTYGAMLLILKEPMVCSVLDAIMGKLCRKWGKIENGKALKKPALSSGYISGGFDCRIWRK